MESVVKFKVLDHLESKIEGPKVVETTSSVGQLANHFYKESYNDGLFHGVLFGVVLVAGLAVIATAGVALFKIHFGIEK